MRYGAIAVVACLLVGSQVWAEACPPGAGLVGDDVQLSAGNVANLRGHSVAYNVVDQEYFCVWFDSRIAGQNDVYAQRVSVAGSPLDGNVEIVTGPESQTATAVVHRPVANEYLVTWRNQNGDPHSPGFNHTFGRIILPSSAAASEPMDLSRGGLESSLAYNSVNDEYFLGARNFAGGDPPGIYARRVSPGGAPLGGEIIVTSAGGSAPAGQIAYNALDNQYLMTWRNQGAGDLRGRIINASGAFNGPEFTISSIFPGGDFAASVAYEPGTNRFFVVFATFNGGPIVGQFVNAAGGLDGTAITLVDTVAAVNPIVSYSPLDDAFLLAWREYFGDNIYAQIVSVEGDPQGGVVDVALGTADEAPRIAANTSTGGFLVAWTDSRNPGQRDIFARLVGARCLGDFDCDGSVGTSDLLSLFAAWGTPDGDLTGDGTTDVADVLTLLGVVGPCEGWPPQAPQDCSATDGAHIDRVRVTWSEVPDAPSYQVFRRIIGGEGGWLHVKTTVHTVWNDWEAMTGSVYEYHVKAVNEHGVSAKSNVDTGFAQGPPTAPANLSASDGTYTDRIRVTWDAVDQADEYDVYRKRTGTSDWIMVKTTINRVWNDRDAEPEVNYKYYVKAVNESGQSPKSNIDIGWMAGGGD